MKNNTHLTVVGLFGLFLLLLSASVQSASATEYLVRVDGAVSTVSVNYNASATSGTVKATVPAGYSFDPTTGIVVPTTSTYLQNLIADIDTVKNTRRPLKSPGESYDKDLNLRPAKPARRRGTHADRPAAIPLPGGQPNCGWSHLWPYSVARSQCQQPIVWFDILGYLYRDFSKWRNQGAVDPHPLPAACNGGGASDQPPVECGFPVTLTVNAMGTGSLSYQWYHNSVPIPGAISPSLSVAAAHFSDSGGYKVVVTDFCGSVDSSVQLIVQDTTQPVLSLPANITANATSKAGAVITFQATALDGCVGSVPVVCTPPSGSTFPIGVTTVNCSANDGNGNVATGSFTVAILRPHHP
ncbi:MAG TPA: HYR domain-containing protein [Candidatus Limnocylindrales bacterium]|nr:HYR domain-containing protein [Candidatus Limnocylindrales bacterium]